MNIRDIENRSRRNNLWFDWLLQEQRKDWHGSEDKIKEKLSSKNQDLRILRLSMLIEFVKKKEMIFRRREQLQLSV